MGRRETDSHPHSSRLRKGGRQKGGTARWSEACVCGRGAPGRGSRGGHPGRRRCAPSRAGAGAALGGGARGTVAGTRAPRPRGDMHGPPGPAQQSPPRRRPWPPRGSKLLWPREEAAGGRTGGLGARGPRRRFPGRTVPRCGGIGALRRDGRGSRSPAGVQAAVNEASTGEELAWPRRPRRKVWLLLRVFLPAGPPGGVSRDGGGEEAKAGGLFSRGVSWLRAPGC